MIRVYLALLQLLGVLFLNLLFNGDVTVKIDTPAQINAGSEIKVQITINKDDIKGFSRFQMDVPAGLTATNINSANADFSFKDQKVRYIWLRMPDDPAITISFSLKCYERLKGNFDLTGKFSYIDNNDRKSIDIQPQAVAIIPSPGIDPALLVDIKDFGKIALPQVGTSATEVACIRQKPAWSAANKQYMVNILVNKESLQKFAKIEEIIPSGFTAVNVDSREGIFTFKDNKAKFLWMNLPADPYFTVSYKLIPAKGTSVKQSPAMTGTFSYIVDDKTLSINIVEKDVSLANLTAEKVKEILQGQAGTLVATTTTPVTQPSTTTSTAQTQATQTTVATNQTVTKQQVKPTQKTTPETSVKQTAKQTSVATETADLLEPQTGIYYRVQLAAGHKPVNIKSYFRKYKLDNTILREEHNGWIKYSVGSFDVYKDARDYRVHIWNTTSITDAFVAAYNSGKRITVQEALMVANQKWYR
ncbi:MAG TPA: hypothetical protein VIH57_15855 [Bacteroidales bacterium]